MARNGAGIYSLPNGYKGTTGELILADQHNLPLEDIKDDLNVARPIVAGGTGATTASGARTALSVPSISDVQSGYVPKVSSKTVLSALDTSTYKAAVVTEATREKLWMWKAGDFSTEEAADTGHVNYIAADGIATSLGCWVAATGDGVTIRTISGGGTGADNASDARDNLGLGSAATSSTTDFATAAQGATADTAVQPGDLATVATSGSQDDMSDGTTNKNYTATEKINLASAFATSESTFRATKTAITGHAPTANPDTYLLWGNSALGDMGEPVILAKVASEPAHPGKIQNGNGTWYELSREIPLNPLFFVKSSHSGDHSLAFADACDTLIAYGGGTIRYPHSDTAFAWNSAVLKTMARRTENHFDFGTAKFQTGSALFLGGADNLKHFLTLEGGAPVDISADISEWFSNYFVMSTDVTNYGLRVGDRIYISDSVNTWNGGDGRPCHFATVDYIDETNNIINFYPPIAIPVPVSNTTTGAITSTGLVVQIYPDDATIHVRDGSFYGQRHAIGSAPSPATPGQSAGGTSPFGLLLRRGRGSVIGTNFYDLCTCLRFQEGHWSYSNSENVGSYNGYGVKIDTRCHTSVSDCVITGSRHAIGVAGSSPDGATVLVVNSIIGGARQAYNSTTYPSEEFGALDLHPSAIWTETINCQIIGGCSHANGRLTVRGGRIFTRQTEGICLFTGQGTNGGVLELDAPVIEVHPRLPANSEGGGAGSFSSSANLFRNVASTGNATGWKLIWKGGNVLFPRGTTWAVGTDMNVSVGDFIFDEYTIDGVNFRARGSNIRSLMLNARGDGTGNFNIRNNFFDGLAPRIFTDSALDDWARLFVQDNTILNDDSTTFWPDGLNIGGDTTSASAVQDIVISGNHIESFGTTSIITMAATARRGVTVSDNELMFTAASGTLSYALRTHRNQNATGQHTRFIAKISGNQIISKDSLNTITTGIQILGLATSGSLTEGYYKTGDNIVETAGTKITTTGTAVTPV